LQLTFPGNYFKHARPTSVYLNWEIPKSKKKTTFFQSSQNDVMFFVMLKLL